MLIEVMKKIAYQNIVDSNYDKETIDFVYNRYPEDIDIKEHEIHTNATEKISDVAMHREKHDADGNVIAEISYINYNKVLIRRKGHDDILKCFDNSHDAVDYYVENMNLNNLV